MVASRSARIMLLVLGASLVALAIACGTFGADAPPGPNDASPDVDTASDVASPVDSGVDACRPEPVWANADTPDSGVPTTATCAGIAGVDLLTTPMHCGRCEHSCGGDECERGYCVPRETAGGNTWILTSDGSALYYVLFGANQITRVVAGSTPMTLARFDADAGVGPDMTPTSAAVDETTLWVRTRDALYKMPKDAFTASPMKVVGLDFEVHTAIVSAGPKLWLTFPDTGKVVEIDKQTGQPRDLIVPSPHALEARVLGSRFVWLEQPWVISKPGATRVRVRENDGNLSIYDDNGELGALALEGNRAFMLRRGPQGGVLEVDLDEPHAATLIAPDVLDAKLDVHFMSVAVDTTHVYWTHLKPGTAGRMTILKRARCGGEIVTLSPDVNGASRLVVMGDRLFMSSYENIRSIAK